MFLHLNPLQELSQCSEEVALIELTQEEFDTLGLSWQKRYTFNDETELFEEILPPPPPPRTIDQAKNEKRMDVENAYNNACNNIAITISNVTVHYPFVAGNRTWNEAVAIQAAYGALPNATPIALEFFGKDGSFTFTSAGAWKNFYNLCVGAYGVHGQTRAQRNAQINNATTIAEVDAITWGV